MRVLLIGAGPVGEAIARVAAGREWLEKMFIADFNTTRSSYVAEATNRPDQFEATHVDASSAETVAELARAHRADLVINAVDQRFAVPVFNGALAAEANYMDMALSPSRPAAPRPFERPGLKLGDAQFERAADWQRAGRLALVGMGMNPGLSDVFAAYAAKHLFDPGAVDEVHVRAGGDLAIPGFGFAPVVSIWTTIEECLIPPIVWEGGEWRTTEPFSAPEMFPFPEGVGEVECINVEHAEVVLVPRWVTSARRVTFKYGLGTDYISKLKTIQALGLDRATRVRVKGVKVAPRDMLAALLPDPAYLVDRMTGRAIVGTWLLGRKDGAPREVFLYQVADAQECWRNLHLGAMAWQTGFNPVIAMELIARGDWSGSGVLGPEAFDPDPYLAMLDKYGIQHAMIEMEPGRHRST